MILYRRAGDFDDWDDRDVDAFLRGRGVPLGPGGIGAGVDDTSTFVRADLPDGYDLAAHLDAYVPRPDPQRIAKTYLLGRAKTIRAKAPGSRTVPENELLAVLTLLRPDL